MKKRASIVLLSAIIFSVPAAADVVMEMTSRDAAGNEMADNTIYAKGEQIRLDNVGGAAGNMAMIFSDDELVVINSDEKEYYVLDQATLASFGAQINEAMQMMEQQLAGMPPEQRAMVEQMMQGQMQAMGMGAAAEKPQLRVEAGAPGSFNDYECVTYTVYIDDEKSQEVCAASFDDMEGLAELKAAFGNMAEFLQKMTEAFNAGPLADVGRTPIELMEQIDGFPVHARSFENGQPAQEVFLTSVSSEPIDATLFAPPAGFTQKEIMPEK